MTSSERKRDETERREGNENNRQVRRRETREREGVIRFMNE